MTNDLSTLGVQELNAREIREVTGGIAWIPILLIAGLVVAFGIGVYNGYKSAA